MGKKLPPSPVKKVTASDEKKALLTRSFQYSGPIPHPSLLNAYDVETRRIIVSMAQKQSQHRQYIEASVISSNIANERIGMYVATFITLFMIGGGIYLLMNDKSVVGFFLIFGPSIFQAGNYIYNRKKENEVKEPQKNAES